MRRAWEAPRGVWLCLWRRTRRAGRMGARVRRLRGALLTFFVCVDRMSTRAYL
jgi:hypothetical protein